MEPEGSFPHSQEPATYPFPEPDESTLCPYSTSWRCILILPPIYAYVFQVVCSCRGSTPKPCKYLSCSPYMLHAPPISFFNIRAYQQ